MVSSWPIASKSMLVISNIFCAYGVNLNGGMLDKNLYAVDKEIWIYTYYSLYYHPS